MFGNNPWRVDGLWPPSTIPPANADAFTPHLLGPNDLRLYNAVLDLGDPRVPGWFVLWALQSRITSVEQIRRIGENPPGGARLRSNSPAESSSHSSDIVQGMNTQEAPIDEEHRWSGSTPLRGRYSEAVFLSMIRRPVSVQNLADDVESVTFVTWVNYVTDIYFRRRMRALGVPGYEQDQDDLPTLEPVRSLVVNALP